MKGALTIFAVVALALTAPGVFPVQSDPFNATWKPIVEKSKFNPGPPFKSETRTPLSSGEDSVVRVIGDGKTQADAYDVKYDGKNYPITGQGPYGADTLAIKSIDANTLQATLRKSDKVLFTNRSVVSKNGKVMTFTTKGTNASGQPFNNVLVYDKQ